MMKLTRITLLIKINMQDLSKLVVYCQATHIKPWSWVEQQQTSVCSMFSFNENIALIRCKDTRGKPACM